MYNRVTLVGFGLSLGERIAKKISPVLYGHFDSFKIAVMK